MIDREIAFHLNAYKESGAVLIMGSGRFIGPKTLKVALNDGGSREIVGAEVVVNVGTHAAIPDITGLNAARPLTHIEALELDYLPSHLIVLGGGYVGIELAQAYRRFGSRVTIIEPGKQLMGREDADVAQEAGADALSLVNTFVAMAIDPETRKPRIANVTAGLSGPAIKPIAVRMVYDAAHAVYTKNVSQVIVAKN